MMNLDNNTTTSEDASLLLGADASPYQSTTGKSYNHDEDEDRSSFYSLPKTVAILGATLLLVVAGTGMHSHANIPGGSGPIFANKPSLIPVGNLVGSHVNAQAEADAALGDVCLNVITNLVNEEVKTMLKVGEVTLTNPKTVTVPNVPVDSAGCRADAEVTATVGTVTGLQPQNFVLELQSGGRCNLLTRQVTATWLISYDVTDVSANTKVDLASEGCGSAPIKASATGATKLNDGTVTFLIQAEGQATGGVIPEGATISALTISELTLGVTSSSSVDVSFLATGELAKFNIEKTVSTAVLEQFAKPAATLIEDRANAFVKEKLPYTISV